MKTTKVINLFVENKKSKGLFWYIAKYGCLAYPYFLFDDDFKLNVKELNIRLNIENIPIKYVAQAINRLLMYANHRGILVWFIE